jgi:polysaccharide export outer membrane protein
MRRIRGLTVWPLFFLLTGCGMFPAAAPTSKQFEASIHPSDANIFSCAIVKLTLPIASIMAQSRAAGLDSIFGGLRPDPKPAILLRAGDTVAISVYEAGGTPLFSPPSQPVSVPGATQPTTHNTSLPPESIEADGTVEIPFAGPVAIAGKTLSEAGQAIAGALRGKASQPQVIVTQIADDSNSVMVGGEVNKPGLIPLTLRGERVLDMIAEAGGSKYPAYETDVRVMRGETIGDVLLQRIASDTSQNIRVGASDQIFLSRNPQTFSVLGASQHTSEYNFDAERVSLAEAIARAGGPVDTVGDITGIYLLRFEPISIAREVTGPDGCPSLRAYSGPVPIAYRLDLMRADQYFLAKAIDMRDKDLIIIADAPSVPMQKLLALLRGINGAVNQNLPTPN